MKLVLQDGRHSLLRFDKCEDVIEGILKFMEKRKILACTFNGIGSAFEIELGYYNQHSKEYQRKFFVEDLEIISLAGNGSLLGGKPAIHAHGSFGRKDYSIIGGHIFKLLTLVTCEIFLLSLEGKMERKNNSDWNLNLLG